MAEPILLPHDHPAVLAVLAEAEQERAAARKEAILAHARLTRANTRQAVSGKPDKDAIWDAQDNRRRKLGLYNLWRQSSVLGAAVDVIAKRFVSGEWSIVPRKGRDGKEIPGDPADQLLLLDFFANCNQQEDFKQILYKSIVDEIIFGETYLEVTFRGDTPYELYSCNTIAMDFVRDGYGGVKYFTYGQPEVGAGRLKRIDPKFIVRAWNPDIQDTQKAFSQVEGMVNPLYSDQMMVKTQQKTFENMGSAAQVTYTLPAASNRNDAEALQLYLDEQYSGVLNASRERVLFGGANAKALALRGLDADFLKGRDAAKYEAMGRLHVPPNMVSLIEAGNLGGGTGESQERNFRFNVLNFYRALLLEKLTYQIIVCRFGIPAWVLDLSFADYAGDPYAEKVRTVNEKRVEQGLDAKPGWDVPILAVETRSIVPEVAPGADVVAPGLPGPKPPDTPSPPQSDKDRQPAKGRAQTPVAKERTS